MGVSGISLTVIVPTKGRRASLRRMLAGLGPLDGRRDVEIVVVDNATEPELAEGDVRVPGAVAVRLLHEPAPGKGRALNRALRAGVGELVAVLDDDMEPMAGWVDAVIASARSRPEFDIFAGRSHVVWPEGVGRPVWAGHWLAQGAAFSVVRWDGEDDVEMGAGALEHPSGNHFWFRRSVLGSVRGFPPVWANEPEFVMAARRLGHRGVFVPEVDCGHRIQPELVDDAVFLERVEWYGRARASFDGPGRGAAVWRAKRLVWRWRGVRARLRGGDGRVPAIAKARMQWAYYDEALRGAPAPVFGDEDHAGGLDAEAQRPVPVVTVVSPAGLPAPDAPVSVGGDSAGGGGSGPGAGPSDRV